MQQMYDVLIIGSGPGGVGAAIESKVLGLEKILVIEKGDNHSQTIRKFYKDNKRVDKDYQGQEVEIKGNVQFLDGTKESTLDYFDQLIDNEEIDVVFNSEVEKVEKQEGYFLVTTAKATYKAQNVIIAIGKMGKPNKPSYKIPPSIRQKVNFNLERCTHGEKILVVGGGDSASEYAVYLAKENTVTLNYRKKEFTRLNSINAKEIADANGEERLRLRMGRNILSLENESGAVKVNYDDGYSVVYDRIIYAIGGTTPVEFLKKCGVALDEGKQPIIDENFETNNKGMYIVGDLAVDSGGSIAIALNHAFHAITHILGKK
ncbi:NAD(P)-binding domain-containing protein [Sulfurospirillum sp. 1612]|uniref:NAD(P)-binding domain-containing protein n=1 Tax=Sulfurospirillum sp. 1612 TaxID=3094835 RepID=UPI002F951EB7